MCCSAHCCLLFDRIDSVQLYLQVGPLPVPVRLDDSQQDADSRLDRIRKSSTSSDRSTTSMHSQVSGTTAAADDEMEAAGADTGDELNEADPSAASFTSGPRFMLSTANTMTASFTLSQEQIAYLISINHPNIQHHFFASFLTRDHALQLLDGILKQKHGRDGFTSLTSPSPLPTPVVSSTNSPASQTRSLSKESSSGSAERRSAEKIKRAQPTAQSVHSTGESSAGSAIDAPTSHPALHTSDDQHAILLPASASQELPTTLSFSSPSSHTNGVHTQLPSSYSTDAVSAVHHSSRSSAASSAADARFTSTASHSLAVVDDASQTDGGDALSLNDVSPSTLVAAIDFGGPDMQPPLGDFNDSEDSLLLDTTFDMDTLLFFHLFYADQAPFSLHSYHAQRATDSEFKMTTWQDIVHEPATSASNESELKRREVEGDLIRRLSLRMQFVTPVGPPVTRVHRTQRWYATDRMNNAGRLDSCSVTPDITFGDQVYILERMYVERVSSDQSTSDRSETEQVRVRVFGGVRFKSRPWKMKPFIGLIQQRSREDVKAGIEQWEVYVKRRMQEEPDKVEACKKRVAVLRGKNTVEQLIPKDRPSTAPIRAAALSTASRVVNVSQQQPASHDVAAPLGSSNNLPASNNRTNTLNPTTSVTTSGMTSTSLSNSLSMQSSAQSSAVARFPLASPSAATSSGGAVNRLMSSGTVIYSALARFLPPAIISHLDSAHAAARRFDNYQRMAALCLILSFLTAASVGPASRWFAVFFLLFIGLTAVAVFTRLSAMKLSLDDSHQQLHTVQQLLMAIKLEQERNGAEQKESTSTSKKRPANKPVSNVVIDPMHFK